MLEVKQLTKVYKTKGGADVRALDGVSLQFPETGMVFLLGKSGSGKSTLLNVCGGLDSPTGGEIVVKGRSSRDFTQSDFDSYRNTFVGFVFQEYNILDEFSVEDNIALALELQGKPKDKQKIAEILEQVDLTGYAKRKPNTLSGGQKQRIAIARALVKSPEIIMADEPTGALDSTTGRQVFDTLKKLSQNKLFIVVSHDREFAEQYGDRIVELKDGKVISDVSKTQEPRRALGENLTAVGKDTLCVRSGAALTEDDFEKIKAFLGENAGDVVIAGGEKDVASFKKAARINDSGEKEVFKETAADAGARKQYSAEESRFIRSKLPARHALKIGASGLKSKPLRLIFTILLSTVSFVMFGLLSTMMLYNEDATLKKSLMQSDYSVLQLNKKYKKHIMDYYRGEVVYERDEEETTPFTPEEIDTLKKTYGEETVGVFSYKEAIRNINFSSDDYYMATVRYALSASDGASLKNKLVAGSFPENDTQICLSSYLAEALVHLGTHDEEHKNYTLEQPDDLIGKHIMLDSGTFTVSGIFSTAPLPSVFDSVKNNTDHSDGNLRYELSEEIAGGFYQTAVFHDDYIQEYISAYNKVQHNIYDILDDGYRIVTEVHIQYTGFYSTGFYYLSLKESEKYLSHVFFDNEQTSLEENDTLIYAESFSGYYQGWIHEKQSELGWAWVNDPTDTRKDEFEKDLFATDKEHSLNERLTWLSDGLFPEGEILSLEAAREIVEEAMALGDKWGAEPAWEVTIDGSSANHDVKRELDVKGIFISSFRNPYFPDNILLLSDELCAACDEVIEENDPSLVNPESKREEYTKYVRPEDAIYGAVFIPYDRSDSVTKTLISAVNKWADDDSRLILSNAIADSLSGVDDTVENLSEVFLWVGLVLALFAALLLCNFISVSITYKKKEIGILRAVGARSFDVFKIFFSESFLITAICVVLSVIGGGIVCAVLNKEVGALLSGVTIFVFGPLSVLMLIGVAFLTAVIATFLPVYHAARKKPVDSIRAL